ncbi:MAG TPA: phosphatase PAP2 family protein [Solirubrobacteraceae bacterium]|nr:phosphatase PAP2 family protein [Solirubrobacteraceae bacterium]
MPAATTHLQGVLAEAGELDQALYHAVAATSTPSLDVAMRRLSRAANYSRISIAIAVGLAVAGGAKGRRAAVFGLTAVAATSAAGNLVLKPLGRRSRPDMASQDVPQARRVRMPGSASFPSGHAAAAVAFASGVGSVMPSAALPLRALALLVSYSRVHTGVHYPGDVVAGALLGAVVADLTNAWLGRIWPPEAGTVGRGARNSG